MVFKVKFNYKDQTNPVLTYLILVCFRFPDGSSTESYVGQPQDGSTGRCVRIRSTTRQVSQDILPLLPFTAILLWGATRIMLCQIQDLNNLLR